MVHQDQVCEQREYDVKFVRPYTKSRHLPETIRTIPRRRLRCGEGFSKEEERDRREAFYREMFPPGEVSREWATLRADRLFP